MKFTMAEVYAALKAWKARMQAAGTWDQHDQDMFLAVTIMLAQPKESP